MDNDLPLKRHDGVLDKVDRSTRYRSLGEPTQIVRRRFHYGLGETVKSLGKIGIGQRFAVNDIEVARLDERQLLLLTLYRQRPEITGCFRQFYSVGSTEGLYDMARAEVSFGVVIQIGHKLANEPEHAPIIEEKSGRPNKRAKLRRGLQIV